MKMKVDENLLQSRELISGLEWNLNEVGYCVSDQENIRSLICAVRNEYDDSAEIIQVLEKSLSDGFDLLVNTNPTLVAHYEPTSTTITARNTML